MKTGRPNGKHGEFFKRVFESIPDGAMLYQWELSRQYEKEFPAATSREAYHKMMPRLRNMFRKGDVSTSPWAERDGKQLTKLSTNDGQTVYAWLNDFEREQIASR